MNKETQSSKNFLNTILLFFKTHQYKKYKVEILVALALFLLVFALAQVFKEEVRSFSSKPAPVKPNLATLPAAGFLPPLHEAMKKDGALDKKVKQLWSYERNDYFTGYPKVNSIVVEILFRWSGLSSSELKDMKTVDGVHNFLRKIYGLGPNDNASDNPIMGEKPWSTMFTHYKTRLLLNSKAKEIYDGEVYYDSRIDKIIVKGTLSKKFIKEFKTLIASKADKKKYINNLLSFIDKTKGIKNLNEEEFKLVKSLTSK